MFCAVLAGQQPNETIEPMEKVRRADLALHLFNEDVVDLDINDIKLVWDLVAEIYIPLIAGQVWHILNPDPVPMDPTELDNDASIERDGDGTI